MRAIGFFLLAVALCVSAPAAFAYTDYQCLKDCTGNTSQKTTSYQCYKKCSYYPNELLRNKLPKKKKSNVYDEFDNELLGRRLYDSHKPVIQPPEKNFRCIDSCLKRGMQYQYCQTQCLPKKK